MDSTKKFIQEKIKSSGPISLEEYMSICLHHPKYGYYAKNNLSFSPIGGDGDFITAPEIGQVFGETIAFWCIHQWHLLGTPHTINLVELGPGNGTMIRDILQTFQSLNIDTNIVVHLVEISPILKIKQRNILSSYQNIYHYSSIDEISLNDPTIVLANEFFDALPINQKIKIENYWHARVVALNEHSELCFAPKISTPNDRVDIAEESSASMETLLKIISLLHKNTGSCLIIDYGYMEGSGDTLQAVHQHSSCCVFKNPGNIDLTAHVNFGKLSSILTEKNISYTLTTQGQFLSQFGAKERTHNLVEQNPLYKHTLESALHRLTDNDKMGQLFKVLSFNVAV